MKKNIEIIIPSALGAFHVFYTDENKHLGCDDYQKETLGRKTIPLKLWNAAKGLHYQMFAVLSRYLLNTKQGRTLYNDIGEWVGSKDIAFVACYPEAIPTHGNSLINLIFMAPGGYYRDALQPDEQPAEAKELFEPTCTLLNHFTYHTKKYI